MTPRIVQAANGTHLVGYLNPGGIVSVGDYCTHCGCDTNAGSGAWVNRIPSGAISADGTTEIVGYICADCQAMECDRCGELTIEYGSAPFGAGFWCDDCRDAAEVAR